MPGSLADTAVPAVAGLLALLLCNHLLGRLFPRPYAAQALRPRAGYLWQLATFHWVHGNWPHLLFNAVPLALLGTLVALQGPAQFWLASACILLVAGFGTWLFSTADSVIGASGLVYGYWGYILASAALSGEALWLAAAGLTLLCYSGLWTTLGVVQRGVSWSCHAFGLAGGVGAALLISY